MSLPISTFRLEGTMDSAYPGYCGTFRACVRAKTKRGAKAAFERAIQREYPVTTKGLTGAFAPLISPIIHYTLCEPLGDKAVWGIISHAKR